MRPFWEGKYVSALDDSCAELESFSEWRERLTLKFFTFHSSCKISDRQLLPSLSFRKHDRSTNQKPVWCISLLKSLMASSVTVKYFLTDLWNVLLRMPSDHRVHFIHRHCREISLGYVEKWSQPEQDLRPLFSEFDTSPYKCRILELKNDGYIRCTWSAADRLSKLSMSQVLPVQAVSCLWQNNVPDRLK